MENKINIAELLKDCPKGMELDYALFEGTIFIGVEENKNYPILIKLKDGSQKRLTKYGCHSNADYAKCVIFPKGKTTWKGFYRPFKDGDIVFYDNCVSIFKEWGDETLFRNYVKVDIDGRHPMLCNKTHSYGKGIKGESRFATEEEKQKLFDAIKASGYRWNAETKTLEKLVKPIFKVWDTIKNKKDNTIRTINYIYNDCYGLCDGHILYFKEQDEYELVPRFNVGNRIKPIGSDKHYIIKNIKIDRYILNDDKFLKFTDEHNFELVPNKFDITTLKPFESRVLVRDDSCYEWEIDIYGRYSDGYITLGGAKWKQCIPYEHNEHLYGTTNDCDDFYKTWK